MKPRRFAPRVLAVVLSACLILPPPAFSLREQQEEDPIQLAGLEQALRDPEEIFRQFAQLFTTSLPSTRLSHPVTTGLEEGSFVVMETIKLKAEVEAKRLGKKQEAKLSVDADRDGVHHLRVEGIDDSSQEMLDWVNEKNEKLGRVGRDVAHRVGAWHRGSTLIVVDQETGQILLQVRAPNKKDFPGHLDVFGGHAKENEKPLDVAHDEAKEELVDGITPDQFIPVREAKTEINRNGFINREHKTLYLVMLKPDQVRKLKKKSEELQRFWESWEKALPNKQKKLLSGAIKKKVKKLGISEEQAKAYFEVAAYEFMTLGDAINRYEAEQESFADGFYSLFDPEITKEAEQYRKAIEEKIQSERSADLEEVKVEEPVEWLGFYGPLGKVRPLTLGGPGVGRAIFPDEQRIKWVSFWNPEISSPSYPQWRHPPIQDLEELKRLHQTGLTLEEWKQQAQGPSPGLEGTRLALLSNSFQTNFNQPWGFLIVEGKTIRQAYAQEEYPLQAKGLSEKGYDEALWAFVLEPGPPRVTAIRFDSENQPVEELVNVRIEEGRPVASGSQPAEVKHALSGVPLILHGEDVSSQIRTNASPPIRKLRPNEVVWPPATTEAAFSALGVTADGQLVLVALTAERTVGQVAQLLLKLEVTDAILLEGSAGVQQWMHGGDPLTMQAEARKGTARLGKGRPLNAVLAFYELPKARLEEEVEQAMERWFGPKSARAGEKKLADFLAVRGEGAIREFVRRIEEDRGLPSGSLGPYEIPPFDPSQIPPAGLTSAGFPIPSAAEAYEKERLRLMAEVAIQRALGRQLVVNIGIGFVGATVMIANAQARTTLSAPSFSKPLQYRATLSGKGQSPYFVLGYNRPSTDSYYKIEHVNQGLAPIRTVDRSIERKIKEAHRRGNIRATFLKEAIAVADFAIVDTELHVRKLVPRHLELSRADPGPTLRLLGDVGRLIPKDVTVLIESTVYPGFTLYDALPVINEQLRKRGLLAEGEDAPLAYSFQRVEPGPRLFRSLMELQRVGAGVTPKAREELRRYYETVGFNYRIWDETTTPEFIKDVENAYRFGLIELMGAFLRGAELAGVNAFDVIEAIASARPETHGTIRFSPALQVGGYCIPKELVMVISGLKSHFGLSDLQIRRIFHTRLAAAVASDFRAESAVVRLLESLAEVGLSLDESTIHWMGVAYNPGVGDTRYSGTERGLRLAAHYGARNEATDPYVHHWPELGQQRLGDPESWGYRLLNQGGLRELEVQATEDLYETIHPRQDALVLATRHPQYVGQGQPEVMRTFVIEGKPNVYPGLDPVKVAARVMGREGKVILDSFNFLSDGDIKTFLALGFKVRGFGKGHIHRLTEGVTVQERREAAERLLEELHRLRGVPGIRGEELEEAIRTVEENVQYLRVLDQDPQDAEAVRLTEARTQLAKAKQERRYAKPGQIPLAEARVRLAEARLSPSIPEVEAASQQVEELTRQRNEAVLANAQRVLVQPAQEEVQAVFRKAASLMEAFRLVEQERSLVLPHSVEEAVQMAESYLYLRDRGQELALDVDRTFEELVTPGGKVTAAVAIRKAQARPELAFPGKEVSVVYAQGEDGRLRRSIDPEGYPNRLSVKTIPDMAKGKRNIPQGRPGDQGDWTKHTKVLPLNLVPAEGIELEAYPDFQELPWEFRHWLLTEVIGKGYVLSTMKGIPQDKFSYAMDVNLDPKTWAKGRGGILFFTDTRQPLTMTTEQGREMIVDIKAVGPYEGGDSKALGLSFDRVTATGMVSGGTVGRMQVGQVVGHMSSAEEIPRLHRLMRTEEAHQGQAPRPLFRVRWKYKSGPDIQFQMVARASPTNQRIGQIFIGGDEDFNPARAAQIMGENAARVLAQPIAGVHEGLNGDNILATGHYTDLAGQIDLFNERNPWGAFYKYFGFYLMLVNYSFEDISKSNYSQPDIRFVQDWLNGFLDKFLSADRGAQVQNPNRFKRFYQVGNQLGQPTASWSSPNALIEDLIKTLWEQYLPYRLLKNRLEYGYNPTEESTYSAGSLKTIYHPESEKAARKFIEDQRELLQIAERLMTPLKKGGEGYVPLKFDFQAAYQEIEAKAHRIEEIVATGPKLDSPVYAEIYRLKFYPPRVPEVYPVLADVEAMTRGEEAVHLVLKVTEPTVFFDKADVGAQAQLAARKAREAPTAGLEEEALKAWAQQTRTLLGRDVSGPVMMEMKGVPQMVFRHRISVSESIPAVAPGSRLLLAQEGVLPSAVTAQFARLGWAVETVPAKATPQRLAGEVQASLKEWTGSVLVVAATELEEAVGLLPVEARLTTVFVDRAVVSGMEPNVLLAYLVQSLDAFPGGIRRLESVTQAGVEEFQAIASQL